MFCDSDDFMPTDALERLYRAAKESNSDVITGNSLYIKVNGEKVLQTNTLKYGSDRIGVIKSLLRHELRQNLWGKMYRRDILLKYDYNTYKDATNGEDACLLYQIVNNIGKMALIEDVVYYYMQNAGSSTQVRFDEKSIRSICILNRTRVEVVSSFPELQVDLNRFVTNILCGLYVQGYNDSKTKLDKYVCENGLKSYVSLSNIIKYVDYVRLLRLFYKWCRYLWKKQLMLI